MLDQLNASFNFMQQSLSLHAQRQEVLSANIANADTPNYKARDFDFSSQLDAALQDSQPSMGSARTLAVTSPGHLAGTASSAIEDPQLGYRIPAQSSLDGNTVDMDMERVNFAENSLHYQADLQMLTNHIHSMTTVMRGSD